MIDDQHGVLYVSMLGVRLDSFTCRLLHFLLCLFVVSFLPGYMALHFTGDYCDTVILLYVSKVRHGHGRSLTEGKALWQHSFNHLLHLFIDSFWCTKSLVFGFYLFGGTFVSYFNDIIVFIGRLSMQLIQSFQFWLLSLFSHLSSSFDFLILCDECQRDERQVSPNSIVSSRTKNVSLFLRVPRVSKRGNSSNNSLCHMVASPFPCGLMALLSTFIS